MISPIRYDVEIQEPLSTPVPMPPSMLSSEALVIWMFRIAMNAPIIAAETATQVVTLARSVPAGAACGGGGGGERERGAMASPHGVRGEPRGLGRIGWRIGRRGDGDVPLGLDGRDHGHAGAQRDFGAAVERDLDRDTLHHLG